MSKQHWHAQTEQEVLRALKTARAGLASDDVVRRRAAEGWNETVRARPSAWWRLFLRQFANPLIVVLVVAAVASAMLKDWVDVSVIGAAILLNVTVGFIQEYKASRALERLRSFVQLHAAVRRDGQDRVVPARDIVPGDILLLQAGDKVAADARLLDASDLEVNEAALTGESLPVAKRPEALPVGVALAERANMVYAGSVVVAGRGLGVVVGTGAGTAFGEVASLVASTHERQTPLQNELHRLAVWISGIVVALALGVYVLGVASGHDWVQMVETSVALAVAAIPEGLTVSVTVILAIGMQRILRQRALTRRLVAAETLGSVSVICTDKTGTITEGEMKVSEIALESGPVHFSQLERAGVAKEVLHILEIGMLCNDAIVASDDALMREEVTGSPTERALMEAGLHLGMDIAELRTQFPRLAELPFDSGRKYMVTLHARGEKGSVLFAKGAPERVLERCVLTPSQAAALRTRAEEMSERGLRIIAIAKKTLATRVEGVDVESSFASCDFVGFVGLRDPLRPEAAEQIAAAAAAGIRTVIITGDHPKTALAIAEEAGLKVDQKHLATGEDLDGWDEAEFARRVSGLRVYARVEPRHKIRIVRAWQAEGSVVAMTGDGVNDAPALKAADVGVALGSGTEVAKEVADIVLLDNNLATITAAVEQGRVIFDNIRKSVAYLMTDSFTEIVLIGGSLLMGLPLPLLPLQILWINLVADTFPNAALTLEPGEPGVMRVPPRPRGEPILNRQMLMLIFLIGIVTDIVLLGFYVWMLNAHDIAFVRSLLFAAVGIDSFIYVFAIRTLHRSVFRSNPFRNPWLLLGTAIGTGLLVSAFVFEPLRQAFQTQPLLLSDWGLVLMMGGVKFVAIEGAKKWFFLRTEL